MSKKTNKKVNFTEKVTLTLQNAKETATKANDYALNATEEIVTETITIAAEWQKVTEKALKGGVQLLDNQQKIVFDALEMYKAHFTKGTKRLRKVFA